ncbi:MAG TPA: FAD-dependent oxidoreductase, partial [Verrucomicrobiae bacterium]|nr:FAD-dependent oxidoreductase [Verrucomicrobiae bacterium]
MNRPLPTGYCNLETARRVHGGRADQYANFLWRTDPLAEAVIDAWSPLPEKEWQAMLTLALDQGIDAVPDAPQAVRDFFAQVDRVPFWVDRRQCNLGGATFLRCRLGFLALSMHALPLIYSWPAGNKPLALSGHLVHRASQRLKDTTRYVFAISQPDGLARFSDGFKMTVRVRLIHAQVRKLLRQSGQWREEAWGAPINQCHMAGTNLLFCVGVLDGLTRIGYRFTSAEREALIHLWRYAGALLGVEDELLVAGEWEGHRLLDLMFTFEPKPDDDSRALVHALMGTAHEYLRGFRAGRPCSMNICFGIARALIGHERADALGFPRTIWRWLVPAIRPATWLIETARCFSPVVQSLARVAGPKAFRHLLSERGLRGRTGDFLVPRQIPVRGMKGEDSSKPTFAAQITESADAGESCPANRVEDNRAEGPPASEPIMNETKNKTTPVKVVCLGGGWVAIYLARALRSAIRQGRVDLTVVSRDNYSTVHGLIAEMLTCKVQPQQINASVREWIAPAHFHNAEIESIDREGKLVLTRRSLDGRAYTLSYDHLVVGLGSVEDLSRYAGIAEHTFPLKTFANCYRLRNHLLSVLEMAAIERNDEERRRLLTFVVAGGNYAGVEVACDLVDYFRLLARTRYKELKRADFRVVLLEIGARILPELGTRHPKLVRYAEKRITRLGIEVRLNQGLNAATPEAAVLSSGETLPSRTIVTCTGMKPSPILDQFPFARDKRGRLITDEFCRVPDAGQIWAGGDCAAVPHPDGDSCPPLAHYAQKAGSNIGENILSLLSGQLLRPYSFNGLGEACTLGHGSAIAHMKGWRTYGWPAWIGWRFIVLFMFVPSWSRRLRLMMDWFLTMILGRDVVNPRIDERGAISHALYEPGQIIV